MALLSKSPTVKYERMLHAARTQRMAFDKECWLNVLFFLGEQHVEWVDKLQGPQRMDYNPRYVDDVRPVANKIQHFVLEEQAAALQNDPTVDILPASVSPIDISISKVAKAYCDWLADVNVANFDEELDIATLWALAGTEAYLKWSWDPNDKSVSPAGRGDICAVSPLDLYLDPHAKRFRKARWAIHSHFMGIEDVYNIYGIEVKEQSVEKQDPLRVALAREMGMAPVLTGATVNELWMPPCRRHPKGMFVVWTANDFLVQPTDYPYNHGQLPFTQIGSVRWIGTPHFTSVVSALRSPQMELNLFHQQMIGVRKNFANPKWFIDSTLADDMNALPDDSPNQILIGNSNGGQLEPKLLMPTTVPPLAAQDGTWIENEMMDTAGKHEVSQAQAPGRVDSAKGIEILLEQDQNRTRTLIGTIKSSIAIGFWQQLQLVKQYGSDQYVFQTYSRDGLPETHEMMTEKINPGMRVRVTMGTGLSASRAAREDQVMNMWGQQVITDPEVVAELLDLPISSVSPDNMYDIQLARNENFEMARGQAITPNSWDNHDIHRREHNNYRKTVEFKMLDDKTKSKFEMHCELHDHLEIEMLGRQLQIQGMAQAVSQGQGFSQPQPPGPLAGEPNSASPVPGAEPIMPQTGGGPEPPAGAPQGGPQPSGNGGTPPPRTGQVPHAAGARPQTSPMDAPQSNAFFIRRGARDLG